MESKKSVTFVSELITNPKNLNIMKNERISFSNLANLQNDNVFVTSENRNLSELTGLPTRRGLENVIISDGQIVNAVSSSYGHLPNEVFFGEVENKLNDAGIKYLKRSINRENRSFAVDYILNDDSFIVKVKNGTDVVRPMLRFVNSYDGSCKTSGNFGIYRQVCTNGLHVADFSVGFSVKHRGAIVELVLPEISNLTNMFMENEYYTLSKKFEVLAERKIVDLEGFVKATATDLNLFKFAMSEKNPMPSLNARMVIDIIKGESELFGSEPTLWNGYNAFNEVLHTKLKKSFDQQKNIDSKLFNHILEMA